MKILIADDDLFYLSMLESMLAEWGYDTLIAQDGREAWELLQTPGAPRLAILDWMMPGLSGPDICEKVRQHPGPEPTYLILLTARQEKKDRIKGLTFGADDYLTKPFDQDELRARLQVGLRVIGLQTSQVIVYAFARSVEAKSPYTQGHADRVTAYALALADLFDLTALQRDQLRRGAILHDIGKISVPDAILDKPGPLTPEEFAIIQRHPLEGAQIIETLESVHELVPLVRWHHERMDGTGYPDRLPGEKIPFLVRLLSVADVYDALSSARPYREALTHDTCITILKQDAQNGGLDPELVRAFCSIPAGILHQCQIQPQSSHWSSGPGAISKQLDEASAIRGSRIIPRVGME